MVLSKLALAVWLYGNFTTMGVIAECPEAVDLEAVGRVTAHLVEGSQRRQVHDLVQVGSTRLFAGSIFWLEPGREYTVDVAMHGKDGKLIAGETITGSTREEPAVPETKRSFHVSPSGNDEAPGTLDEPLRTLREGLVRLLPNTTLFLREGTYYEGDLETALAAGSCSGVAVRAYPGESVAIDGADPALISADWREADGVFTAPFEGLTWNVTMKSRTTGEELRLYPVKTLAEMKSRTSVYDGRTLTFEQLGFTGAYHCDGENIHIVPPSGGIGDWEVFVSRFTRALRVTGGGHYTFAGIEFRHFGRGDYGSALEFDGSSENLITDCRFNYCNIGVAFVRGSDNNTVQDCSFVDDLAHWHFAYTKTPWGWDYHEQIETGGVYTRGRYTGRGLVVRRNRFEGLFDGVHLAPWVEVNAVTSETDFIDNEVIDIADDFFEADGYSRNIRIVGNYMDRSLSGISLAQALDGPTFIVRNVIANSGVCVAATNPNDYLWEGYPVKTNGGYGTRIGSGEVFFYHNTAWTADPKARAFLVKTARWKKLTFRNNIWCGAQAGLVAWNPPLAPVDWDWDNIHHAAGPFLRLKPKDFQTIEAARGEMGQFAHAISADPHFADTANGDFHLDADSPCVDAGVVVPGINDGRFAGEAPDMGAYEAR